MPFSDSHLEGLRQSPASAFTGNIPNKKCRQAWFAYFWMEAANPHNAAKFDTHKVRLLAFFNALFEVPAAWQRQGAKATPVRSFALKANETWEKVNDAVLYGALESLLFIGFERFRESPPDPRLPPNDTSYQMQQYCHGYGRDKLIKFVWRGEGRSLEEVTNAGGLFSKAESDYKQFAESCGMREDWHPFNNPDIRKDYWFRLTSADNCCESVVSVTDDVRSAVTFPRMDDLGIGFEVLPTPGTFAARHPDGKCNGTAMSRVTGQVRGTFDEKVGSGPTRTVPRVTTGAAIRYADTVKLYLCLVEHYFDTAQRQADLRQKGLTTQESFPEIAVKKVPAADIIGSITFVRVFIGGDDSNGMVLLYHKGLSRAPTYARIRDRFVKKEADIGRLTTLLNAANTVFEKATKLHLSRVKWTGSGAVTVAAELTGVPNDPAGRAGPFTSIEKVELSAGSPTAWRTLWSR